MFYNSYKDYKSYPSHLNRLTSTVKVFLAAAAVAIVLTISQSPAYASHFCDELDPNPASPHGCTCDCTNNECNSRIWSARCPNPCCGSGGAPTPPPSTCTIQGFKMLMPGNINSNPASAQTVTAVGAGSSAAQPYFLSGQAGAYSVYSTRPAGYTNAYSLCYNSTGCHGTPPNVPLNGGCWSGDGSGCSTAVNCSGGFADLWWHYYPNPTNLNVACGNGTSTFSWTGVPGYSYYLLRLNHSPVEDWYNPGAGDQALCVAGTSITTSIDMGIPYVWWWVQASNPGCTARYGLTQAGGFTCAGIIPTDTPVLIQPSDTPVPIQPSDTPIPGQPTDTPVPSDTPVPGLPTDTPVPTDAPVPSESPTPIDTPTPTIACIQTRNGVCLASDRCPSQFVIPDGGNNAGCIDYICCRSDSEISGTITANLSTAGEIDEIKIFAQNNTNISSPSAVLSITNMVSGQAIPFKFSQLEPAAEYTVSAASYKNGASFDSTVKIKACDIGSIRGSSCSVNTPGYTEIVLTSASQATLCETQGGFCTTDPDCQTFYGATFELGKGCTDTEVCCNIPQDSYNNTIIGSVFVNYNPNNIIFSAIKVIISPVGTTGEQFYTFTEVFENTPLVYLFENLTPNTKYDVTVKAYDLSGNSITLTNFRVNQCQGPLSQVLGNFCRLKTPGTANFSFAIPSGCTKFYTTIAPENSTACHTDVWGPIAGAGTSSCGLAYKCLNNGWQIFTDTSLACGNPTDSGCSGFGQLSGQGSTGMTNEEFSIKIQQWLDGTINAIKMSEFISKLCRVPGLQKETCDPTRGECQEFRPVCSTAKKI